MQLGCACTCLSVATHILRHYLCFSNCSSCCIYWLLQNSTRSPHSRKPPHLYTRQRTGFVRVCRPGSTPVQAAPAKSHCACVCPHACTHTQGRRAITPTYLASLVFVNPPALIHVLPPQCSPPHPHPRARTHTRTRTHTHTHTHAHAHTHTRTHTHTHTHAHAHTHTQAPPSPPGCGAGPCSPTTRCCTSA